MPEESTKEFNLQIMALEVELEAIELKRDFRREKILILRTIEDRLTKNARRILIRYLQPQRMNRIELH